MNALQRVLDRWRNPQDLNPAHRARRRYMQHLARQAPPQPRRRPEAAVGAAWGTWPRPAVFRAAAGPIVGVRLHEVTTTEQRSAALINRQRRELEEQHGQD